MSVFAKYNPFNNGETLMEEDLLKAETEITAIRKVCKGSVSSILETLTFLKVNEKNYKSPEGELIKESIHWKSGEQIMARKSIIPHSSPVKDVLELVGHLQLKLAQHYTQFGAKTYSDLRGDGPIQKMVEDKYNTMMKEKEVFCNKQKVFDNLKHNYAKEKKRNENSNEDPDFLNKDKENRLKEEMDIAERDVHLANDRIAATLYSLQAEERDYAENLVQYVKNMQIQLENVLADVKNTLPELENIIATTKKRRVFGEDLETHLRLNEVEVALPLKIAVEGLDKQLQETGLFRIGPAQLSKNRLVASIDAGVNERAIHKYFDSNPHVYTTIMKSYLRELPQPILCSEMLPRWQEASLITDKEKRREEIREILASLPEAYETNIGFLFKFLAMVVAEKEYNKMTIDNIIIVMGPNLIFDPLDPNQHADIASIKDVLVTLIEDADDLFLNMDHLFDFTHEDDFEVERSYSEKSATGRFVTQDSLASLASLPGPRILLDEPKRSSIPITELDTNSDENSEESPSSGRRGYYDDEFQMRKYSLGSNPDILDEAEDTFRPESLIRRTESDKRGLAAKPDVKKHRKSGSFPSIFSGGFGNLMGRSSSKIDQAGAMKDSVYYEDQL